MPKSLHSASAMIIAMAAAIHPTQAQGNAHPGPFSVGIETGIQFLDLPGVRYGGGQKNGYKADTTNTSESDVFFGVKFGYALSENTLEEYLGTNQQLEISYSNFSVDDHNISTGAPGTHFDISGVFGSGGNNSAQLDAYEYRSNEFRLRLLGEQKTQDDGMLKKYLGASYTDIQQNYTNNVLGFSSSPLVDETLATQLFSLFVGAEQEIPIRKGLAFVVGGEAGIFYADSRLKGTQDPNGVYATPSTTTLSVTRGDTEWGPRLKAKTGFLLSSDDGKSSIGLYGQADYINNMAYIDNPNTAGESLKISNGDTLSYSINVDFTWWF